MIETTLIIAGILVILIIGAYQLTKYLAGGNTSPDQKPLPYTKEELDNIKLVEELYNKDLRPEPVTKSKPQTPKEVNLKELEIELENTQKVEKPKKKRKYYPNNKK
jgi:hypothetical protein